MRAGIFCLIAAIIKCPWGSDPSPASLGPNPFARAGREDDAEPAFRKAIDIADSQGARLLALRAATSLGKLLVRRGGGDEAEAILRPRYASLSEGLDAPDATAARDLLDALPG